MKFGQLIEYDKRKTYLKNYAENDGGRLVPKLFVFCQKSFSWGKSKWAVA